MLLFTSFDFFARNFSELYCLEKIRRICHESYISIIVYVFLCFNLLYQLLDENK